MLERWFGPKIHHYLHIVGMMVLAFGLPFNKVLMSIGSIWGLSNLILEGKFQLYFENIRKNRALLWLLAFFGMHFIALIWTSNFDYALHDLRIKLPLFAVPIALVAHPIILRKEINLLLLTFLTSVLLISLVNGYHYSRMTNLEISANFREISVFGSHIRFSILVIIGLLIAGYFFFTEKKFRLVFLLIGLWFLMYTYFSQVLSGPLSVVAMLFFMVIYWVWQKKILRYALIAGCIALFGASVVFVQNIHPEKSYDYSSIEPLSSHGNMYYHDTLNPTFENGRPIYIYICYDEVAADWSQYFHIPRDGKDKKGNPIEATFLRYMTAKNLRKDREGLKKLTKSDLRNIENGIANPNHLQTGFRGRLAALHNTMENYENPNNSTILQRIEYWKTADHIILKHPILGVGTGDVQDSFNAQYEKNKSKLIPTNRLRAHNMFLTIQLTFGVFGTLIFLFFLGQFLHSNRKWNNLFAFCVFGAIIASFFVEDTLETQTGVTLFSFFLGLCLVPWQKESSIENK